MKILVTGSTGFIGSALIPALAEGRHTAIGLRRVGQFGSSGAPTWNPATGAVDPASLDGADAIVHLAGENIGEKRWTAARKKAISDSRVAPTREICNALANMTNPPPALIVASAIGYYGDRGDEWLDEASVAGAGFLAEVVKDWEVACEPARQAGIRVVNLRFGVILSTRGGALKKMLLPFKMGVGGRIGSGKQFWSWVTLDDVIGAILHALTEHSLTGPVNVVAPNPATNREFTKTLAHVLSRPAIFPLPAFMARLLLGEMANELLLSSARVRPAKLLARSYQFRYPELKTGLRHLLGRG